MLGNLRIPFPYLPCHTTVTPENVISNYIYRGGRKLMAITRKPKAAGTAAPVNVEDLSTAAAVRAVKLLGLPTPSCP